MTIREQAKNFLDRVADVDNRVKVSMSTPANEQFVLDELVKIYDSISSTHDHLLTDIENRIIRYHATNSSEVAFTDFIQLLQWYEMSLTNNPSDYFDPNGQHYSIRMSEVINMFLIAKLQC